MSDHVCPWWLGYLLINPLRRFAQDPKELLSSFVHQKMTVLEPGPGMGFFTLELARLVGSAGRVVVVDIQPRMLEKLKRRAAKQGLLERIDARLVHRESMALNDLKGKVDFTLAFAMVHELPEDSRFFAELSEVLKPGALLLLSEPRGHVKAAQFEAELKAATDAGLGIRDRPSIRRSYSALLQRTR
jgi:SAM-dependent methyltransferase